ncbi:MAG: sensor domain-containing diguanylate cyclase [Thermotogota bacterium]
MKNYLEILEHLGYGIIKGKILYKNETPNDIKIIEYNDKVNDFMSNNPDAKLEDTVNQTFINEPIMHNLIQGFIKNIKSINNKTVCIYSDKSKKYYEITSYIDNDEGVFVIKDTTEKNEKDIELQKTKRRLNIALDIGKIGWWELNIQTGKIYYHKNKAELIGYTTEEFPNDMYEIMDLVHPEDYEPTMEAMRKHLRGEKDTYNIEYRIKGKDNKYHWYYDQGQIIERDIEGTPKSLIGVIMEITERKETELKLEKIANYDVLTSTYNRRMGLILLDEKIKYAKRHKSHLTICFLDQDNLKKINDYLGHDYGDEALITISDTIKNEIRESDILCRMGGDEFLIIFDDCDEENARDIVKRVRESIKEKNKDLDYNISFSVGFYEYNGKEDINIDEFIKKADEEMYEEKNAKKQYKHDKK